MELRGKVALVTGASSGIGRATALAFGRAGAVVGVADVDEAGGVETLDALRALGAEGEWLAVDVADPDALTRAFASLERDRGGIDVVVNNAGIMTGDTPGWPEAPLERLEALIRVNLGGVVFGTRLAVDALGRRGGGAVVNTASVTGLAPLPDDPVYAATKAGILHFTRSCAALASRGIRVNAVVPAMVDTPIIAKTGDGRRPPAWLQPFLDSTPLLAPERIAESVLELARDESLAGECRVVAPQPARRRPDRP